MEIETALDYKFSQAIEKEYGSIDQVLEWCQSELSEKWAWEITSGPSSTAPCSFIFYFNSERDTVAFRLKWH